MQSIFFVFFTLLFGGGYGVLTTIHEIDEDGSNLQHRKVQFAAGVHDPGDEGTPSRGAMRVDEVGSAQERRNSTATTIVPEILIRTENLPAIPNSLSHDIGGPFFISFLAAAVSASGYLPALISMFGYNADLAKHLTTVLGTAGTAVAVVLGIDKLAPVCTQPPKGCIGNRIITSMRYLNRRFLENGSSGIVGASGDGAESNAFPFSDDGTMSFIADPTSTIIPIGGGATDDGNEHFRNSFTQSVETMNGLSRDEYNDRLLAGMELLLVSRRMQGSTYSSLPRIDPNQFPENVSTHSFQAAQESPECWLKKKCKAGCSAAKTVCGACPCCPCLRRRRGGNGQQKRDARCRIGSEHLLEESDSRDASFVAGDSIAGGQSGRGHSGTSAGKTGGGPFFVDSERGHGESGESHNIMDHLQVENAPPPLLDSNFAELIPTITKAELEKLTPDEREILVEVGGFVLNLARRMCCNGGSCCSLVGIKAAGVGGLGAWFALSIIGSTDDFGHLLHPFDHSNEDKHHIGPITAAAITGLVTPYLATKHPFSYSGMVAGGVAGSLLAEKMVPCAASICRNGPPELFQAALTGASMGAATGHLMHDAYQSKYPALALPAITAAAAATYAAFVNGDTTTAAIAGGSFLTYCGSDIIGACATKSIRGVISFIRNNRCCRRSVREQGDEDVPTSAVVGGVGSAASSDYTDGNGRVVIPVYPGNACNSSRRRTTDDVVTAPHASSTLLGSRSYCTEVVPMEVVLPSKVVADNTVLEGTIGEHRILP